MTAAPRHRPRRQPDTCLCGCGRRPHGHGYASGCLRRWNAAGRPASGPPPRMSYSERNARARASARSAAAEAERAAWQALDAQIARDASDRHMVRAAERDVRAAVIAADLRRALAAGDLAAVRLLRAKADRLAAETRRARWQEASDAA